MTTGPQELFLMIEFVFEIVVIMCISGELLVNKDN